MLGNIEQNELGILNFLLKEHLTLHCLCWEPG